MSLAFCRPAHPLNAEAGISTSAPVSAADAAIAAATAASAAAAARRALRSSRVIVGAGGDSVAAARAAERAGARSAGQCTARRSVLARSSTAAAAATGSSSAAARSAGAGEDQGNHSGLKHSLRSACSRRHVAIASCSGVVARVTIARHARRRLGSPRARVAEAEASTSDA